MSAPTQLLLQVQEPRELTVQQRRVLTLLQSKPVIELPEMLDLHIASYTRRISDLRVLGYDIRCETSRVNGVTHSKYRLVR